jgi:hypothetical protein
MAKRKHKLTWADRLWGLLFEQEPTKENMLLAASALGGWLGDQAGGTMPEDEFKALLAKAVEQLELRSGICEGF